MKKSRLIAGVFFLISTASAQTGAITNIGTTTNNMDAIAFNASGTLYGATSGTGSLYTIDPATGVATLVHALVGASNSSLTYGVSGLAFQPGTGKLFASTSPDSPNSGNAMVTINPATGEVTVIGPSGSGRPYADIAFAPNGTLYGWLIGSGSTTVSAATVNLSTGAGTSLGNPQTPAALPDAGSIAVNANGVIYVAANGHQGGVCSPTQSCSGVFWTINPTNGAPTTIGTITGGPGVAPTITALAFSSSGVLYGIEGGDGGAKWNLITIGVAGPAGTSGTIVIPNANATIAGGDTSGAFPTPLTIESQTLIDPSQFSSVKGPILITGFAFRAAPGVGALSISGTGSFALSTSPNWPNPSGGHPVISTTLANNRGSDYTPVLSGGFTISAAGCTSGPCPFADTIPLATPFVYDPSKGPLLIDATLNFISASGQFDVADCNPASCVVNGVVSAGGTAPSITNSTSVMALTYAPAVSPGTTTNINLSITANTLGNVVANLFNIAETGSAGPLGNATLYFTSSQPIAQGTPQGPVQITAGLYFNQVDSISIAFTETDVNFATAASFTMSGGVITGGTGAYVGATGSLNLTFNQSSQVYTTSGSGSVTAAGKTTALTLTNFAGSAISSAEETFTAGTAAGTASPLGSVTAHSKIDNSSTPPQPSVGVLTVSPNGTDSFNLFLSVLDLGGSVLTFPATVAGGTGAYSGATGSFTLTLGRNSAGMSTIQGTGTLTTALAGVPIITSVKTASGLPMVAYNTWLQINGKNLTPANTPSSGVTWGTAPSFAQNEMPIQLGPVSVTINGKPAYIFFYCSAVTDPGCVSGDQINVLAPLDTSLTPYPAEVVVTNGTVSSTPFTILKTGLSPAFPVFDAVGHVAARHLDFSLVGPSTLIPGLTTPAKAGETLILVTFGFGPPGGTPPVEGSAIQSGPLAATPLCWVSGQPAQVVGSALISPGLYQINVALPLQLSSGDNPIACTFQGVPTAPGAIVAVQ